MGVNIVGVAGPTGAGKSAVATEVAAMSGGERVSFGDYVRQAARERGLGEDRSSLQELSASLLLELGAEEFTSRVVGGRSGLIVVDGVRHLAVDRALRRMADRYLLVYVDVDEALRRLRLGERPSEARNVAQVDAHSTERELPQLRDRADIVIHSTESALVAEQLAR